MLAAHNRNRGRLIETDPSGQYPDRNRIGRVKKISDAKPNGNGSAPPFNDKIPF